MHNFYGHFAYEMANLFYFYLYHYMEVSIIFLLRYVRIGMVDVDVWWL